MATMARVEQDSSQEPGIPSGSPTEAEGGPSFLRHISWELGYKAEQPGIEPML